MLPAKITEEADAHKHNRHDIVIMRFGKIYLLKWIRRVCIQRLRWCSSTASLRQLQFIEMWELRWRGKRKRNAYQQPVECFSTELSLRNWALWVLFNEIRIELLDIFFGCTFSQPLSLRNFGRTYRLWRVRCQRSISSLVSHFHYNDGPAEGRQKRRSQMTGKHALRSR